MNNLNNQIHFIGIGAQKAGTSWLYANLCKLPEYTLPPFKELHYFDRDLKYSSPNTLYHSHPLLRFKDEIWLKFTFKETLKNAYRLKFNPLWLSNWVFSKYNDNWYLSLFKNLKGIKGEITPSYSILDKEDIERMYKIAPNAKIVLILRNPIERAWSHYKFASKKSGFDFAPASYENVVKFVESEDQLRRSDYITTIKNYKAVFPKNQILICFYDAIIDCPELLLHEITSFISGKVQSLPSDLSLRKKVHATKPDSCPKKVVDFLKSKYHAQIQTLAEEHGSYFQQWLEQYYESKFQPTRDLAPVIHL